MLIFFAKFHPALIGTCLYCRTFPYILKTVTQSVSMSSDVDIDGGVRALRTRDSYRNSRRDLESRLTAHGKREPRIRVYVFLKSGYIGENSAK